MLHYRISFGKRFVLQTNSCISCTVEAKVLFKVCLWAKILLSIANSTSQCSAQNLAHLGSKATNRRRDSFLGGHDQRSRCQVFANVHCLPASTLLVVYKKSCYFLFSISVAIGQFPSNWPSWSSRTVTLCSYFANALEFDTLLIQLNDTWSFSWLFVIFFCGIEETGNLYFSPKSKFIKLSNYM